MISHFTILNVAITKLKTLNVAHVIILLDGIELDFQERMPVAPLALLLLLPLTAHTPSPGDLAEVLWVSQLCASVETGFLHRGPVPGASSHLSCGCPFRCELFQEAALHLAPAPCSLDHVSLGLPQHLGPASNAP